MTTGIYQTRNKVNDKRLHPYVISCIKRGVRRHG